MHSIVYADTTKIRNCRIYSPQPLTTQLWDCDWCEPSWNITTSIRTDCFCMMWSWNVIKSYVHAVADSNSTTRLIAILFSSVRLWISDSCGDFAITSKKGREREREKCWIKANATGAWPQWTKISTENGNQLVKLHFIIFVAAYKCRNRERVYSHESWCSKMQRIKRTPFVCHADGCVRARKQLCITIAETY